MLSGEPLLARLQEDSLPVTQAVDGDVQLDGHALERFSPQDAVDRGVFLGRTTVSRPPAGKHKNRIQRSGESRISKWL